MAEQNHAKSDEALFAGFVSGDRAALEELARRHQGAAYDLALRILGRPDLAQDAVQNAFLHAIQYAASFDPERRFKVWFMAIVINAARRVARERGREQSGREALTDEHPPQKDGFAEQEEAVEMQEQALAAVAALPERYRLPLVLRYIHGLAVRETAAVLCLRERTVRTRLSRGLGKVRARLQKLGIAVALPAVETALRGAKCEAAPSSLTEALQSIARGATPMTSPVHGQAAASHMVSFGLAPMLGVTFVAALALYGASLLWTGPGASQVRAAAPAAEPATSAANPYPEGVWIEFGKQNVEHGIRIVKVAWSDLGLPTEINGRECRQTQSVLGFCLDVDDAYISNGNCPRVSVLVDYLDKGKDTFYLGYDSLDSSAEWNGTMKRSASVVKTDTGQWKTARFLISDALFSNRTANKGDFIVAPATYASGESHERFAQVRVTKASLTLSTDPAFAMAEGRRTVTVTASVTDAAGRPVPDGTVVSFQATHGSIAPSIPTKAGQAVLTLTAVETPGNVKLKATAGDMDGTITIPVIEGMGDVIDVVIPLGWFEMPDALQFVLRGQAEARYSVEPRPDRRVGRLDYSLPPQAKQYPRLSLYMVQKVPGLLRKLEIDLLGNASGLSTQLYTKDDAQEGLTFELCPSIDFRGWRTLSTPFTSVGWSGGGNNDHQLDYPMRLVFLHADQRLQSQAGSGTLEFANPRLHCTVAESQTVWVELGSPFLARLDQLPNGAVAVPVRLVNLTDTERRLDVAVAVEKEKQTVATLGREEIRLTGREQRILNMAWKPEQPGEFTLVAEAWGGIIDVKVQRRLDIVK